MEEYPAHYTNYYDGLLLGHWKDNKNKAPGCTITDPNEVSSFVSKVDLVNCP